MTIVSIRGTHGSGKSTIVKKILEKYPHDTVGFYGGKRPDGYLVRPPGHDERIYIVGPYLTACGGCDAVQPYDRILEQLAWAEEAGHHILLEGALVSSSYGRVGETMNRMNDPIFAFLDTPLEVCLDRIAKRRATKWAEARKPGAPPPVNPKNTAVKHENVARTKHQMAKLGSRIRIVDIDHKKPVQQIMKLFGISLRKEP